MPSVTLQGSLVFAVVLGALIFISPTGDGTSSPPELPAQPLLQPPLPLSFDGYDRYGFDKTRFTSETSRVRRHETLSDILRRYGVEGPEVAALVEAASGVFDVRSLRAGVPYRVYRDLRERHRLAGLVYEASRTRYVVFELRDRAHVAVWNRPVLLRREETAGVIEHSLYVTLEEQKADVGLAFELSEIFAWQIDFHHLYPGDRFSAVYDRRYVGGEPVGIARVHGARFHNSGREFVAYHFDEQGPISYFDDDGNSLRKSFLAAPVRYSRISSRYSGRRFHPVLRRYRAHLGTDYAAPRGTPIRATGDGVVIDARYRKGNGRYVKIRHNGTYTTAYLHMSRFAPGIRAGSNVLQGDVIGYVGSTGLARGPHVCYRFWKHGRQVDPLKETFPSAQPVAIEHKEAFDRVRARLRPELDALTFETQLPPYAFMMK